MKRIIIVLFLFSIAIFTLSACGEESSEQVEVEVKEQDIELTDEKQKDAADTVKAYIKAAYSNTDFSSLSTIKGLQYMGDEEEWHQGFADELKFITNNGKESFAVEDVIIKELVDLGDYYEDTNYSPVYIINSKVVFKEPEGKETYENMGILLSYDNSKSQWDIDWYNFAQPLEEIDFWGSKNAQVVPTTKDQEAAAELVKQFTTDFLSLGNRESVDDLAGMVDLWVDKEKESIKENILSMNESFFQLDKETRPVVANVKLDEILTFKEMPLDNATDAYAINVSIEYEENKGLDLYELGFVVVKIDGEWKILQNLNMRLTPWEFVDKNLQ